MSLSPSRPEPVAASAASSREYWVDALRALGITFVLLGHTVGIGPGVMKYIYVFHMPLFFFVSGYLHKRSPAGEGLGRVLAHNARALLVPYAFFGMLTWLFWVLVQRRFAFNPANQGVAPWVPLVGMVYGVGTEPWLRHNVPLWFLPCLFVTRVLFHGLARARDGLLAGLLVVSAALGCVLLRVLPVRLPWSAEVALVVAAFYGAGLLARRRRVLAAPVRVRTLAWLLPLCVLGQWAAMQFNGRVDLGQGVVGQPFFFFTGAFAGIVFWAVLCQRQPRWRWLARVGESTLTLFPLHLAVFSVLSGVLVRVLNVPASVRDTSAVVALLYTGLTIAMLLPVHALLQVYLPEALGLRRAARAAPAVVPSA